MPIYEPVLKAIQKVTPTVLAVQERILGLPLDIYYPLAQTSIYNDYDKYEYADTPTYTKRMLIVGIHEYIKYSAHEYDQYIGNIAEPPIIITLEEGMIPRYSKVVCYLLNKQFHFMVEYHDNVAGVNVPIIIKHTLRPCP